MLASVLLLLLSSGVGLASECYQRQMDHGLVCVCNLTHCDTLTPVGPLKNDVAVLYTTSKSGNRLHRSEVVASSKSKATSLRITLNLNSTKQTILGFGGAFTDAVGMNMRSLPTQLQKSIIDQYFHPDDGIGYTFGRVPMASCDFSTREYSYDDSPLDFTWSNFSLATEDFDYKIPYIKQAQAALGNVTLKLFATPWSPPGWMKNTGKMVGGGEMLGDINGKYWTSYPQYFIRFFEEYHKNGVDFWGLTSQNEPTSGADPLWKWQTMLMTPALQRDFVKKLLGPALRSNDVTKNLKLMMNDDQRYNLPLWPEVVMADPESAKYFAGIGLHWYEDMLVTEACAGYFPADGPKLGDWARAEEYAGRIMADLQNWAAGFVDWNLVLDMTGGPNFCKNFVDAAIIVNANETEYYKQPIWHVIGQFSKFVLPDAVVIEDIITNNIKSVETIAFLNPDGSKAVVILNKSLIESHTVEITSTSSPDSIFEFRAEANSLTTVLLK